MTFLVDQASSQKLELSRGLVRSVTSHMVFGPVKNLRGWIYQRGGSVQKKI